jgi:hypothetical protein
MGGVVEKERGGVSGGEDKEQQLTNCMELNTAREIPSCLDTR